MKPVFYTSSGDADYLKDVPINRRYWPVEKGSGGMNIHVETVKMILEDVEKMNLGQHKSAARAQTVIEVYLNDLLSKSVLPEGKHLTKRALEEQIEKLLK